MFVAMPLPCLFDGRFIFFYYYAIYFELSPPCSALFMPLILR